MPRFIFGSCTEALSVALSPIIHGHTSPNEQHRSNLQQLRNRHCHHVYYLARHPFCYPSCHHACDLARPPRPRQHLDILLPKKLKQCKKQNKHMISVRSIRNIRSTRNIRIIRLAWKIRWMGLCVVVPTIVVVVDPPFWASLAPPKFKITKVEVVIPVHLEGMAVGFCKIAMAYVASVKSAFCALR